MSCVLKFLHKNIPNFMIKIYSKKFKNKHFYYLTEQIRIVDKYKKLQVYLGKNIPKNLSKYYDILERKERDFILKNLQKMFSLSDKIEWKQIEKIELARIKQKYFFARLSRSQLEKFWGEFAIEFIFQSNAIEGSKLSAEEVKKIIEKKYIKKSWNKKEVIEVQNSLHAFEFIRSDDFKLNQKNIKRLHRIITANLDIDQGYKKKKVIVNNKDTVPPQLVKGSLQKLIVQYKKDRKSKHLFFRAIDFHADFEFIHPFADGNGRVGRMILIWMLWKDNYGMILFKLKNRMKYFKSLDHADEGRRRKWYWFATNVYEKTMLFLD